MAFGPLGEIRHEDGGHRWVVLFDDQPAVKLVLAARSPSSKDVSLYWRGSATPQDIDVFISSLSKLWVGTRVFEKTLEGPREIRPADIGIGTTDFPNGRVFLTIRSLGEEGTALDLWADGRTPHHKLTREVGIAYDHELMRQEHVVSGCADLLEHTFEINGSHASSHEVKSLLTVVNRTIEIYSP